MSDADSVNWTGTEGTPWEAECLLSVSLVLLVRVSVTAISQLSIQKWCTCMGHFSKEIRIYMWLLHVYAYTGEFFCVYVQIHNTYLKKPSGNIIYCSLSGFFSLAFYFEMTIDSHAVVRKNPERCPERDPAASFPQQKPLAQLG